MSYKAVFEFILLLHDFKNVDLPNQGLVAVSASIYKEQKSNKKTYATAHPFPFQRNYKLSKKKTRQDSMISDMFFRSKVIVIRYTEQLVPLDDFIQFRLQLEGFPYLNTDDVFLQLNLLFCAKYYASDSASFDGNPVAQVRMKLKDIQNGIFCYSEADFKQDYFSKVGFTIYGQLMRYKFEKYELKSKQPSTKELQRSKIQNFGKLIIWSKQNYLQAGEDPFDFFYSNYVKKLRHSNYLIQLKINNYLQQKRKVVMKVSQKFMKSKGMKPCTQQIDQKLFRQYLQEYKQPLSLTDIDDEVQKIHIDNFQLINTVSKDLFYQNFQTQSMQDDYQNYVKEKFGQRVFKNIIYQGDKCSENALKQNKKIAKEMRNKNISLTEYPCENQIFLMTDDHEFIFYEITFPISMKNESFPFDLSYAKLNSQSTENKSMKNTESSTMNSEGNKKQNLMNEKEQNRSLSCDESSSNNTEKSDTFENNEEFFSEYDVNFKSLKYEEKNMLVVMCHGFQGSSYDMTVIHKGIKTQLPNANYLISRTNESDTESDIEKMGERLADEIKRHVRSYMDEETVIINLIGHSMGGIIARASLQHLTRYRDQLGFFCSLSSPHLGYLNGVDNKIKAGLWVLRKWKPIKSLDQLSMQEAKNPRKTFLYKLSKTGTLKYFRKLIFFSSFEDSYVTWHSARVSPHPSKNQGSRIQAEMVDNILGLQHGKNKSTVVHRLDINFNVKGNNIDSLIGRAAHINLIIQDSLFEMINATLPMLFNLQEHGTGLMVQKKKSDLKSQNKKTSPPQKSNFKKEGSIFTYQPK